MFTKKQICENIKAVREEYNDKSISNMAFSDLTLSAYDTHVKHHSKELENLSLHSHNETLNIYYSFQIENQKKLFASYSAPLIVMNYVYGVIMFEDLFTKIIELVFKVHWKRFDSSKRIEKEVNTLTRKSLTDQIKYLDKEFSFSVYSILEPYHSDFIINLTNLHELNKVFQIRNLIVHKDSVIDEYFLSKVENAASYVLGEKIVIDSLTLKNTLLFLNINANHLVNAFEKKYCAK